KLDKTIRLLRERQESLLIESENDPVFGIRDRGGRLSRKVTRRCGPGGFRSFRKRMRVHLVKHLALHPGNGLQRPTWPQRLAQVVDQIEEHCEANQTHVGSQMCRK